jgi:hypothetical protein
VIVAVNVDQLAALALAEAERHPARSHERRAASHLWVSLTVPPAKSVASARNAVASFGDERTQAAALDLLHRLAAQLAAEGPATVG